MLRWWIKQLCGLALIPVCVGLTATLVRGLTASGGAASFWVCFGAGAACFLAAFSLLPKPMWIYVLGHELTHALWTWMFGGKVSRIRVSSRGGAVTVDRTNFLITLAPYFFPLYAVIFAVLFGVGSRLWNWGSLMPLFHLGLGACYAFHLTLTAHILAGSSQSDIESQGVVFAAAVIWLGNVGLPLLALPCLAAAPDYPTLAGWAARDIETVLRALARLLGG